MNNQIIVISHDTRCDGTGELNGMLCYSKEKAKQYIIDQGYESEEFGWDDSGEEYSDEDNHIYLMEKEINE